MRREPSGSSIGERKTAMIDMVMLACPVSALSAMKMSMVMSALGSVVTYIGQAQAASRKKAYQDNLAKMQREA